MASLKLKTKNLKFISILLFVIAVSCNSFSIKNKTETEKINKIIADSKWESRLDNISNTINASFEKEEIDKLDYELNTWINMMEHYGIGNMTGLKMAQWKLTKPLINSKYNRMVAFILMASNHEGKVNSYLHWINGYFHKGKWYFFRLNETQYIEVRDGVSPEYDPMNKSVVIDVILRYTNSYLVYNSKTNEWNINDNWFYGFMDNANLLFRDNGEFLTDEEIRNLPENVWIDQYMKSDKIQQYCIDKTIAYWKEEDEKHLRNEYSDEEWKKIQARRNPKTTEDIMTLIKFNDKIIANDMDTNYVNLRNDLNPMYKINLEKRIKMFGQYRN